QALNEKSSIKAEKDEITKLEQELASLEEVYADPKHKRLEEKRQEIDKKKKALEDLKKKLIPEIKKDLTEYHRIMMVDSSEETKAEIEASKALIAFMNSEMDRLEERIKKQAPESLRIQELLDAFEPEEAVVKQLLSTRGLLVADMQEAASSAQVQQGDKAVAF